jgi:hypothetical protein
MTIRPALAAEVKRSVSALRSLAGTSGPREALLWVLTIYPV